MTPSLHLAVVASCTKKIILPKEKSFYENGISNLRLKFTQINNMERLHLQGYMLSTSYQQIFVINLNNLAEFYFVIWYLT